MHTHMIRQLIEMITAKQYVQKTMELSVMLCSSIVS